MEERTINCILYEDEIDISNVVLNKEVEINGRRLKMGYATMEYPNEHRCFFAIQLKKKDLEDLDLDTSKILMGDTPFMYDYEDSILYLRKAIDDNFFKKKEKHELSNLLETR